MPENKRYKDWYDEQIKNYDEGHVEREKKRAYNKLSDERQYKAYVERLGTNAPYTFKAFQNIEYSQPEAWSELKSFFAYKKRVPEETKTDFLTFKQVKET
jgi:hypothetical protein